MSIQIVGSVEPGFEKLQTVFEECFEGHEEMGAALSVYKDGKNIATLWGGVADSRDHRNWTINTPTTVFSCTKGLMSIIAAKLVSEGKLDYDAPVASYWPEFAANGKDKVTVAELLSHRAGLSAPRKDFTFPEILGWQNVPMALAEQEPLWNPGEGYAYHALTHGWLAGELLRRVTGKEPGQLFAEMIAVPLGADAWIGLPKDKGTNLAHIRASDALIKLWADEAQKPAPNWPFKAMTLGHALPPTLVTDDGGFNHPDLHKAQIPGAGGIATADALARIWSATVAETDGVRLLDDDIINRATVTQSEGAPVFAAEGPYCRWGMGFQLDSEARRYLGEKSFGHDGAGGQCGFADMESRVGFGFVTNWMMGPEDTRATKILDVLRASL